MAVHLTKCTCATLLLRPPTTTVTVRNVVLTVVQNTATLATVAQRTSHRTLARNFANCPLIMHTDHVITELVTLSAPYISLSVRLFPLYLLN